jgi:hypothetical protein
VRAHDEHHQREADVRQQLQGRVGGVDDAEAGFADDEPRE